MPSQGKTYTDLTFTGTGTSSSVDGGETVLSGARDFPTGTTEASVMIEASIQDNTDGDSTDTLDVWAVYSNGEMNTGGDDYESEANYHHIGRLDLDPTTSGSSIYGHFPLPYVTSEAYQIAVTCNSTTHDMEVDGRLCEVTWT